MPFILSIYNFIHTVLNFSPIIRQSGSLNWMFFFMVLIMILITTAKLISTYRFQFILQSSVSSRHLSYEGFPFFHPTSILLLLASSFILGTLFTSASQHFNIALFSSPSPYITTLIGTAIIILTWIIKDILIIGIGNLFDKKEMNVILIANQFSLNVVTAFILFILNVFYTYYHDNTFLQISLIILLLSFVIRIIRALISMIKHTSFFLSYFILYLCILEIIPILVIYKFVSDFLV